MRYDLEVSYKDKDKVKSLGARWDVSRKLWYVVDPENLESFEYWRPKERGWEMYKKRPLVRTGPKVFKPLCSCAVEPWEDCEHTEALASKAMAEMLN